MNEIGLDEGLRNKVISLYSKDKNRIDNLCKKCRYKGFSALIKENDLTKLCVCIKYAVSYTKQRYSEIGISDEIFTGTMQDINIWCKNNDNKGLKNYAWIQNHLKCELFRIGRLQYQLFVCNNTTYDYDMLPFEKGDNTIFVHIPQGEKLEYAKCIESLKNAKAFFEKFFKNYEYRFFICESWLLFEDNWLFMKPSCNILQFQSLFDIVMSVPIGSQAIERIFGKRRLIKKSYPENTSLQRSAKQFIMSGGKLGVGLGIIDKYEV